MRAGAWQFAWQLVTIKRAIGACHPVVETGVGAWMRVAVGVQDLYVEAPNDHLFSFHNTVQYVVSP
jgi:hypothetical protein